MNALLSLLAQTKQSGGLASLAPLLLLGGAFVYMMIVPQRKQKKRQAEFLSSLRVGDDVITSGGIHGTVSFLEDSVAHILVDTDVVIRVSKASLTRREGGDRDDESDDAVAEVTDLTDGAEESDGDSSSTSSKSSKSSKS